MVGSRFSVPLPQLGEEMSGDGCKDHGQSQQSFVTDVRPLATVLGASKKRAAPATGNIGREVRGT